MLTEADNLSVDGWNTNITVNVDGEGSIKTLSCHINETAIATAPKDLVWNKNGTIGIKSRCKATNADRYCCVGKYKDTKLCRKADTSLYKLCPNVYWYAFDDETSMAAHDHVRNIDITFGGSGNTTLTPEAKAEATHH